jgi:hypothetical protein
MGVDDLVQFLQASCYCTVRSVEVAIRNTGEILQGPSKRFCWHALQKKLEFR